MAAILTKAKDAKAPDRLTQDFLSTKLGFKGGNAMQFIPLAKKIGLLGSDGSPTELYHRFRNSSTSRRAMAEALRIGFRELFERNEYAHELEREKLKGLVVEITGKESRSRVVQLICQTFDVLKKLADFDSAGTPEQAVEEKQVQTPTYVGTSGADRLNLCYTFNLVLPKTDDPTVFAAIFRALRENLLNK
jgi:hypothetical protein